MHTLDNVAVLAIMTRQDWQYVTTNVSMYIACLKAWPNAEKARFFGKLFGDKGYLSQALFDQLLNHHALHLITKLRKNMKNRLMLLEDKILLRKRAIIESIHDQLKNISQIEHTCHSSPLNFLVNLF